MNSTNTTSGADEPELLGEHREHEVALLDRQEPAADLAAVREAGADHAARPDGHLRLGDLPARALGVGRRVEERQDPVLLVVAQQVRPARSGPRRPRRRPSRAASAGSRRTGTASRRGSRRAPATTRGPAGASPARPPGPSAGRRPAIAPIESSRPSRFPRYVARTMIIRIFASSENWNVNGPNDDPARRAADAVADRERQHEQAEVHEVDRPGERLEPAVVERRRDDEHDHRRGPTTSAPAGRRCRRRGPTGPPRRCSCRPSPGPNAASSAA